VKKLNNQTPAVPTGPAGPTSTPGSPTSTPTPLVIATPTVVQNTVNLGSAGSYAVLAYSGITNSGASSLCGNLGLSPKSSVGGGIVLIPSCGGIRNIDNTAANTAKGDLGIAFTDAMGRTGGATLPPNADLGGLTLYPGLYFESGDINLGSGDLTLDALGDSTAVFIFQAKGSFIRATSGRKVILAGGAQANNVFWVTAGYCSLGTTVQFAGTIMAYSSVTMNTGATLNGRALAKTGNVTLLANTITDPTP